MSRLVGSIKRRFDDIKGQIILRLYGELKWRCDRCGRWWVNLYPLKYGDVCMRCVKYNLVDVKPGMYGTSVCEIIEELNDSFENPDMILPVESCPDNPHKLAGVEK